MAASSQTYSPFWILKMSKCWSMDGAGFYHNLRAGVSLISNNVCRLGHLSRFSKKFPGMKGCCGPQAVGLLMWTVSESVVATTNLSGRAP